jgi:hypothetical protein
VRKVERCGIEVDVTLPVVDTPIPPRAGTRAKTMAKQKGRKSCRDRRKLRLAREGIAMGALRDKAASGKTLELPIRTKPQ